MKRWRGGLLFVTLLSALVVVASCAHRRETPSHDPSIAHRDVERVWMKNEHILVRILNGRKFYQHKFVAAVDFFERVTGMPGREDMTFVGRIPTKDLAADLQRWRDWYQAHKEFLYLDSQTGAIVLRPQPTSAGSRPNTRARSKRGADIGSPE